MPFQTRDLWMLVLGIEGDQPPNSIQPPLPDGMHLRWTFDPIKGFPWYGYYLFRRPSRKEREPVCIRRYLSQYKRGLWSDDHISVGFGNLSSDELLMFTDDFPSAGLVEVDLAHRRYVRYEPPAGEPIRWVEVTVGFRKGNSTGQEDRVCADFRREQPAKVDNTLVRSGASFTAFGHDGGRHPSGRLIQLGGEVGWDTGYHAEIELPCPVTQVEMVIAHAASAPKMVAIDASGNVVDSVQMSGNGPEALTLSGRDIAAIHVEAPKDETILSRLCWSCGDPDDDTDAGEVTIPVEARWGGIVVATTSVSGAPGDVKQVQLEADAIDRVDIGPGNAALIDLCVVFVSQDLTQGWEPLERFDYPLCLPVAQGDYPCPGAPSDVVTAELVALDRITYGPPSDWAGSPFSSIHSRMESLVVGGPPPGGAPMLARSEPMVGTPAPPPEAGGSITQRSQRPLDLLLLGSLHPAIAQMLGLYWWDKSAAVGVPYDYLLLADHNASLGGSAASALAWISSGPDFSVVDGFVSFGNIVAPAVPVPAPDKPRAYALPGSTIAEANAGATLDATNNAGLVWDRKEIADVLAADAPVLYHVWRAELGDVASPPVPNDGSFGLVTKTGPLPVSRSIVSPPQVPQRPFDWPPFPLHYIDRGRTDGWYAYRVNAIDLFGRHSATSSSAEWRQWSPAPDPRPWYYVDPPGDAVLHATAVRLLDKIAPPPPTGVEAFALDPDDPTVLHDAAWQTWRDSLSPSEKSSVIGARVRWRWTVDQQRQAPDTREFRIYYQPSPVNILRGRVVSTSPVSATETDVVTDIANAQPANSFAGVAVRIGVQSFVVVGSQAGSPLQLRVKNIGAADSVRPNARVRCAVSIPPSHPLYEDFAVSSTWQARMLAVAYNQHVSVAVDGGRTYEVFLPLAGSADRAGLPLGTTLQEPVATGIIGVTAADNKTHTADVRGDAARFGNESGIGGPATVLRVRQVPPPAPATPPDSPRLFASPADYHNRSYFTYKWLPSPQLKTYVYRALDDALFRADLARQPRSPLAAGDLQFFPEEATEPAWDTVKRQQVADELNGLDVLSSSDLEVALGVYRGLSNDGLRVLAGLPGSEKVFAQITVQPLDPDEPEAGAPDGLRWRRVGPDVATGSLGAGQRAFVDTLDGRGTNRWFYRAAYVDEVYNRGPLGLSSPPVWLPNVTPPGPPVIIRIGGGERQVTLEWASNREPDLAEYRVYRADNAEAARDIRLMTLIHTVAVPSGDPAARPASISWVDEPVPGLVTFLYRLVAVDDEGNVSDPTPAQAGHAHDQALPAVPAVTVAWVEQGGVTRAQLDWTSDHEVLVQRRSSAGGTWVDLTSWRMPGTVTIRDPFSEPSSAYQYRLWTRKYTGAVVRGGPIQLEAQ